MDYDILLKRGMIVDGLDTTAFIGDIGIKDGRIAKIGNISSSMVERVIDVKGKFISPGFIDFHSHSDLSLLANPKAESKIRQGVTTEVCGNCGFSAAPCYNASHQRMIEKAKEFEIECNWNSLNSYLTILEQSGLSINFVPFIGQGNIRASVIGYENRVANSQEINKMQKLLAKSLSEGGFGLSSGLIYPPGCWTNTEELLKLAQVLSYFNVPYATHLRSEGKALIESVKEAVDIVGMGGVPRLNISHLKTAGKENWHKIKDLFGEIEEAIKMGINITVDRYPYTAASTNLDDILPEWVYEGGVEQEIKRLKDPNIQARLFIEILDAHPDMEYWDSIIISSVKTNKNKSIEGMMFSEIMRAKDIQNPCELLLEILIEEECQVEMVIFGMSEENLREILKKPYCFIGSDSSSRADYGILSKGKPHPRAYGTFPRVISEYVLKEKLLTIEEAINKMTYKPAQFLGLNDRGRLKEGKWADIVVLDLNTIKDVSTYQHPHQYPLGIEYVIVNGEIVLENGEHSNKLSGKVLRRQ